MTTGRINQVTICICTNERSTPFSRPPSVQQLVLAVLTDSFPQRAFVTRLQNAYVNPLAAPERILRERILSVSEASDKKHLVPRSHNVSQPVHSVRDEDPGRSMRITPSNRSHLKDERSHDISSVVDRKQLTIQRQATHSLLQRRHTNVSVQRGTLQRNKCDCYPHYNPITIQYTPPGRSINGSFKET